MDNLLAVADPPSEWWYPVFYPSLLSALGVYLYYKAWAAGRFDGPVKWRWLAFVPLIFALYVGGELAFRLTDVVYNALVAGNKARLAHYAGLAIPILAIISVALWERMSSVRRRSR